MFSKIESCIQHALSRLAGYLANSQIPWLKRLLIQYFVGRYPVDLSDALEPDLKQYPSFNAFFTRQLKSTARPLPTHPCLISPVDGRISQFGKIDRGTLLQAKGHYFTTQTLLAHPEQAALFEGGEFMTLYLAPPDYHRVHMPIDGTLQTMTYIPGQLFSVSPRAVESTPQLYARNERVVQFFSTAHGPLCVILVGAMLVGSIEVPWVGTVAPGPHLQTWHYEHFPLRQGEELGHFKLGSTVIILCGPRFVRWGPHHHLQDRVRLGQALGELG